MAQPMAPGLPPPLLDDMHPPSEESLAGKCDVALASVSFHRCLITFWQVSDTRHCQSRDLTLECHLRLGHLWVGNSEMDPSTWFLNIVALNCILVPDVQPVWHFRMSCRSRCWRCSVAELGFEELLCRSWRKQSCHPETVSAHADLGILIYY